MPLVSTTIPNLIGGVSQQPPALRLPNQAENLVNGLTSVVEGLKKRPPMRLAARITTTPTASAFIHTINRDSVERYEVVLTNGDLKVYNLAGVAQTVSFPNGKTYLNTANPSTDFSCLTINDFTFIANRSVTVTSNAASALSARPFEALVWVREAAYAVKYSITIGGMSVFFWSNSAAGSGDPQIGTGTDYVTTQLFGLLTGSITTSNPTHSSGNAGWSVSGSLPAGTTVTQFGSVLYISNATTDFSITTSDGLGDTALKLIKGSVQSFTDLPAKAVDGVVLKVTNSGQTQGESFWVKYTADTNNPNGGTWAEAPKQGTGELLALTDTSMPWQLVRVSAGNFKFDKVNWDDRKVGELATIPFPSFVGSTINDIFFYRDRLGLLSDENMILSGTGQFFNFFRQSAIQVLDDDPIDVSASNTKPSILRRAVPFGGTLLLISDQAQFLLGQTDNLTTKTVAIERATQFEISANANAVSMGRTVMFPVNRGDSSGVREFYIDPYTRVADAEDVTSHVPSFIPDAPTRLTGSPNEQTLLVQTSGDVSSLYVYRFFRSENTRVQAAWSRWFGSTSDTILGAAFIESDIWAVVSRPEGTFLLTCSLDANKIDAGSTYTTHLDMRVDQTTAVSTSFNSGTNKTTITVPYKIQAGETFQVVAKEGDATYSPGTVLPFTSAVSGNNTQFVVTGNVTKYWVGRKYEMRLTLSPVFLREPAGNSQQSVNEGRLQVKYMSVNMSGTGYLRAEVTPKFRTVSQYTATVDQGPINFGDPTDDPSLFTGNFKFPVFSKNDQVKVDLVNDTFLPSVLVSLGWEGFFNIRSKRL